MNRINPLHIIAFIVVLSLFFTFKLNQSKDELQELKTTYKETLTLANKVDSFSKSYKDKVMIKKRLNKILNHPILSKYEIKKEIKNSKITLTSSELDKSSLNYLMSKLLNSTFNITKLNIKSINDSKASLRLEIKW